MKIILNFLRCLLICALTVLLIGAELFTGALYLADSLDREDVIYEIAKNIDLRDFMPQKEQDDTADTLWDIINGMKKEDDTGALDNIESTEDFMHALTQTEKLKEYMRSLGLSFISGDKQGTDERVSFAALKDAVLGAITELTGEDASLSENWKIFAEKTADMLFNKVFDRVAETVDPEDVVQSVLQDENAIRLAEILMSESTRRRSVFVCTVLAVILSLLCRGMRSWFMTLGISAAVSGLIFMALGFSSGQITDIIAKTDYYFLAIIIPMVKDTAVKWGLIALGAGGGVSIIATLLPRRDNR